MREFFDNGYGISVVNLYGNGQLEIAVLKGNANDWDLCYDTVVTDDVIAGLSEDEVNEYAAQIANL